MVLNLLKKSCREIIEMSRSANWVACKSDPTLLTVTEDQFFTLLCKEALGESCSVL